MNTDKLMNCPITFTQAWLEQKDSLNHQWSLVVKSSTGVEYYLFETVEEKDLPALCAEALENPYGRFSSLIIRNYYEHPEVWEQSFDKQMFPKYIYDSKKATAYFRNAIQDFILPLSSSLSDLTMRWVMGDLAIRMRICGCKSVYKTLAECFHVCARTIKRHEDSVLNGFYVLDYPLSSNRLPGGGRKSAEEKYPTILDDVREIANQAVYADPMGKDENVLHQSLSQRTLVKKLCERKIKISQSVAGRLLDEAGFSKKQNKKLLNCNGKRYTHEEQLKIDEFFQYRENVLKHSLALGIPFISVDTKKKENLGNYYNVGKVYTPKGKWLAVLDHDFPSGNKAIPYGIYEVTQNKGFVVIGSSHDTAQFAVNAIERWINHNLDWVNKKKRLVISADGGGSNGKRCRLWKRALSELANKYHITIHVLHHPAGKSKFNYIEHRLFAPISRNWSGLPLKNIGVAKALIEDTTTNTGLTVMCEIDDAEYSTGIKVSKGEMDAINIIYVGPNVKDKLSYEIKPNE